MLVGPREEYREPSCALGSCVGATEETGVGGIAWGLHAFGELGEVRCAVSKAPHVPEAGGSNVSMFDEKLQVDLSLLGDTIALRVMDVCSKNSLLIPARTKRPQEVWDTFSNA